MLLVLYGSEYWKDVMNFAVMANRGTTSPDDLKLFRFFDDIEQTFTFLTQELAVRKLIFSIHS